MDFWQEPGNPANWKAEQARERRGTVCAVPHSPRLLQTVLIILGTWAVVIKGAMTYFGK